MIKNWIGLGAIAAVVGNVSFCLGAMALPGQLTADVESWIAANPSFRDSMVHRLSATRFNTAAQKLTFEASIYAPDSFEAMNMNLVRSERVHFFDVTNGVSFQRLSEALRTIYGVNVYQDFSSAKLVDEYPDLNTVNRSTRQGLDILASQEGKLLEGDRFAYWLEIVKTSPDSNFANQGQITILLKEDLPNLQSRLGGR